MEPARRGGGGISARPIRWRHRVCWIPVRRPLAVPGPRYPVQCSASLGPAGWNLVALQTAHPTPLHLVPRTSARHCGSLAGAPELDPINQQPDPEHQPQRSSERPEVGTAEPPPAGISTAAGTRSQRVAASDPGR